MPDADYRVRIFAPAGELPFAGHPTFGSCQVWLNSKGNAKQSRIVQECGVELVQLRRDGERLAFAAPPVPIGNPIRLAIRPESVDAHS